MMIEHHRNPCFLPSNAPALTPVLDRALQERSANRQHQTEYSLRQKPCLSVSRTENAYSTSFGSSFQSRIRYYDPRGRTQKDKDREVQMLFRELQRCEGYQKYRARQPKNAKAARARKWPDHMEWAFFKATVEHLPMGRRQEQLGGKACGRNEHIAHYVTRLTGEKRHRKQVSSHIQVLKPLVKDYPRIMYYLGEDASTPNKPSRRSALSHVGSGRRHDHLVLSNQCDNDMARSNSGSTHDSDNYAGSFGSLPSIHSEPSSPNPAMTALKPFDFDMFVQDTRRSPPLTIHTFTKSSEQLSDSDLDVTRLTLQWELMFPQLAIEYHAGTLSCPVIYAKASLELMTHPIPEDAQLGIRFEFKGAEDLNMGAYEWMSSTRFYDKDACIDYSSGPIVYDVELTKRLHTVPFGSSFWAQKFVDFAKPIREARRALEAAGPAGHNVFEGLVSGPKDMLRQTEENVRQQIRELSAVQEIWATPVTGGKKERVLLIYWKFKQAVRGEQGRMQWRNLILPSQLPVSVPPAVEHSLNNFALDFGAGLLMGSAEASQSFPTTSQHFSTTTATDLDPTSSFEFDASLTLAGLSSAEVIHHNQPRGLHHLSDPDNNTIDFSTGQINICMEPGSVSMESFEASLAEAASQYEMDGAMAQHHQQEQFVGHAWAGYGALFDAAVPGVVDAAYVGQQVFLDPQIERGGLHDGFYHQAEYGHVQGQVGGVFLGGVEERE